VDPAETVYVVDLGSDNARFRTDLRAAVTAAGCALVETAGSDRWMQDCMELGYASVPGTALRSALRTPRPRPLKDTARHLLAADLGYLEQGHLLPNISFNYGGNIEASPPVTVRGKRYPFGRIYYGQGDPGVEEFDADLLEFLRRQRVQDPIPLNTSWLAVGHVDEVVTFVPAAGGKGFKLLVASPKRAYAILDSLKAAHGADRLLVGRELLARSVGGGTVSVERTINDFLGLRDDFHPDLHALIAGGMSYTTSSLRAYNRKRQTDIDAIRDRLRTGLGLAASDIIAVPVLFTPNPDTPEVADALTGNMINMLVVNGHCIVPKPFGPVTGGADRFEQDLLDRLGPLGLTVHLIDDWTEYHVLQGEIHCGTHTLRTAKPVKWWEFTP
jgi:protein-arginine deiminase